MHTLGIVYTFEDICLYMSMCKQSSDVPLGCTCAAAEAVKVLSIEEDKNEKSYSLCSSTCSWLVCQFVEDLLHKLMDSG